jgi:hypothetical protein
MVDCAIEKFFKKLLTNQKSYDIINISNKERGVCTMEKKITKREMFTKIREVVVDNADMVDFIDHEIALLDKKSTSKKPTKTQEANEGLKTVILSVLTTDGKTASEVLTASDEFAGLSNQKISSLLNALVKDGKVVKETDNRKSVFKLA